MFNNLAQAIQVPTEVDSVEDQGTPEIPEILETSEVMFGTHTYPAFQEQVAKHIEQLVEDPSFDLTETDTRFSTAINISRLRDLNICIIGAGGIGSWMIRTLVGMGAQNVSVFDDDIVEIHNVGPQAHNIIDLGMLKVDAMAHAMLSFKGVEINPYPTRVNSYQQLCDTMQSVPDILIVTADNMVVRNELAGYFFETINNGNATPERMPSLYIDTRMGLGQWNTFALPIKAMTEAFDLINGGSNTAAFDNVLGFYNKMRSTMQYYEAEEMFSDAEGVQEPCTERAIIYTGANVSTYVAALLHWWNDNPTLDFTELTHFLDVNSTESQYHWMRVYNSRNWVEGLAPPTDNKTEELIYHLMAESTKAKDTITTLQETIATLKDTLEAREGQAQPSASGEEEALPFTQVELSSESTNSDLHINNHSNNTAVNTDMMSRYLDLCDNLPNLGEAIEEDGLTHERVLWDAQDNECLDFMSSINILPYALAQSVSLTKLLNEGASSELYIPKRMLHSYIGVLALDGTYEDVNGAINPLMSFPSLNAYVRVFSDLNHYADFDDQCSGTDAYLPSIMNIADSRVDVYNTLDAMLAGAALEVAAGEISTPIQLTLKEVILLSGHLVRDRDNSGDNNAYALISNDNTIPVRMPEEILSFLQEKEGEGRYFDTVNNIVSNFVFI